MADITLTSIEEVEPYGGPNAIEGIRFRALRQALGVTSWGMNVLELSPNCENHPEHSHQSDGHEEVYVVLEGSAVLKSGSDEYTLNRWQMAFVPGERTRKLIAGSEGATILALGGTPGAAYKPSMGG